MVQVAVLSVNGEGRTLKTAAEVSPAGMAKALRKSKPATAVGTYEWNDAVLTVWGWTEGKAGTENKNTLPAPYDEIELFGDIIVSSSEGDFTIDDWKKFGEDGDDVVDTEEDDVDNEVDAEDIEEEVEEEEVEEVDVEEEVEVEEEAVEEEDENDECYDDGEDGGGSKRRAPRRRNMVSPEYRRIDMGLRSRVKMPVPPGKRAPRWQTAPELEPEPYTI